MAKIFKDALAFKKNKIGKLKLFLKKNLFPQKLPSCPAIVVMCTKFDIKHNKGSCKSSKKYKGDVFSIGVKRFSASLLRS